MQTRAALLQRTPVEGPYTETRPLSIVTAELAEPGPGEVLVRIRAAGLCHSDLSVIDGARPRPVPMVLGHEAAGEVVRTGAGVDDLAPGEHVVMVFVPSCGHCVPCASGRPALCAPGAAANGEGTLLSGARRLVVNKAPVNHHLGVSAFADYAVVSRRSLVPVPADLPFEIAALFGCAVLTGVGAVINTAGVTPGQSVAVVGLGGVGLSAVLGALASGAHPLIAVDLNTDKLAIARELGATHTINAADTDAVAQVRELSGGGVDHALEMAGAVPALELAWQITRRGGTTTTAGLAHPRQALSISPAQLVAEERTLKGSYVGGCIPVRDIPRFVAFYRAGKLPIQKLLTSTGPLEDINAGFDALAQGRTIRHVVVL